MDRVFDYVLKDLKKFSPDGQVDSPMERWTTAQSVRLLQQYPAGISKSVLLTELEYRWRTYLKRGEHVGKLKQAVSTKQLSLSDILTGELGKIDEHRRVCESTSCICSFYNLNSIQ